MPLKKNLRWMKLAKFAAVLILGVAAGACQSCGAGSGAEISEMSLESEAQSSLEETAREMNSEAAESTVFECVVHVCGAVNAPGVYVMPGESRIWDAVERAGGFSESADQAYLNLAQEITDGMKIEVPTFEEAQLLRESGQGAERSQESAASGKVNLNTATKEELMSLRGIGESRAEDIIRYRENFGPFERIEDIMNISGIKEAAFQKIKESIAVR